MNHTHPNFESYVAGINNAKDMDYEMWSPLERQTYVRKKTTPKESLQWNDEDLQNFTIRIKDIDRLYLFNMERFRFGKSYEIVARINPQPIYVQLNLQHYYQSIIFKKKVGGLMYISEDPNLFIKVIRQDEKCSLKRIMYTSLKNEGIHLSEEDYDDDDDDDDDKIKQPPMLKDICYNTIYQNNDKLEEIYINQLPIVLKENIKRYIETRKAILDYNE